MAKRLPCTECGQQTRHYDSKYGVNLICSECGTCVPVYRKTRPAPPPSATTDLFNAPRPVPASGTLTGEDRPQWTEPVAFTLDDDDGEDNQDDGGA